MPLLRSILLDSQSLLGDRREERKTIDREPFNYKNDLTMRSESEGGFLTVDLPSLIEFRGEEWVCGCIGSVILESRGLLAGSL